MFTYYYEEQNPNILHVENKSEAVHIAIDCNMGLTVEDWTCAGVPYIVCDTERKAIGRTYGVPILYPTPNRVKDEVFTFEGKTVPSMLHGALRHQAFVIDEVKAEEHSASVAAHVDYTPELPAFAQFPYRSCISVLISLTSTSIRWDFKVENLSEEVLPFSLALHPFFVRRPGTTFDANFTDAMDQDENGYPTGKLLPVEATNVVVGQPTAVDDFSFDRVFCMPSAPQAHICYPSLNKRVHLMASDAFRRMVIYTPPGESFFCMENQTSSTDCHNMHNKGFVEEAHLQIVPPAQSVTCFAEFSVTDL